MITYIFIAYGLQEVLKEMDTLKNCIKEIQEFAKDNNIVINIKKIDSLEKAKNVQCVFNNWANFKDGKFLSNTLLNRNMVEKLYKQ